MKINETFSDLRSAWVEWRSYLANQNFVRVNNTLEWPQFERVWTGDAVTVADLRALAEKRQWSFQIAEDGGLVQLRYHFGVDGELEEATVGYYGRIPSEDGDDAEVHEAEEVALDTGRFERGTEGGEAVGDQEVSLELYPYEGLGIDYEIARAVRIDYAREDLTHPTHHTCHMHLGGYPSTRICVSRVPTPRQFLELVFVLFYPDSFRKHRLSDTNEFKNQAHVRTIYAVGFADGLGAMAQLVPHLFVPGA